MKKLLGSLAATIFLVIVLGLQLIHNFTIKTLAASGQNVITANVNGTPPSSPPTIDSPGQNQNFDYKNIEVTGSCLNGLTVKIFDNNIFAGSAVCINGIYTVQIDLFEGRNDLVARQYNSFVDPSPDSNMVTVYFLPKSLQPNINQPTSGSIESGFLLYINYDYTIQGVFPYQEFKLPIVFAGGVAPYAVSVDWGDGSSDLVARQNTETFYIDHKYKTPGLYTVKIKITDSLGDSAYKQFVILVKGERTLLQTLKNNSYNENFQILLSIIVAIILFLAGAYYQRRKDKKINKKILPKP